MNALPSDLILRTSALSEDVTRPIPGSRKVHVQGSRADLQVPMREIALADTPKMFGAEKNTPFTVYDTSGPYTDPAAGIDLTAGLPALRATWIRERGDTEQLTGLSSEFGRRRAADPKLAAVRFPAVHRPLRARAGMNVSQMHYAKRGIITPEMEYIAIRENQRMQEYLATIGAASAATRVHHPGESFGAHLPELITPEFVRDEVARGRAIIPNNINRGIL